jgi:hypothetical protein
MGRTAEESVEKTVRGLEDFTGMSVPADEVTFIILRKK